MIVVLSLLSAMQSAAPPVQPAGVAPDRFSIHSPCDEAVDPDVILVCRRATDGRYRLPLHVRGSGGGARERGAMPDALSAITPHARCGPFAGERQCSRREAEEYGYGRGRDPVTLIGRIVERVLDPDAD